MSKTLLAGYVIWGGFLLILFGLRPKSFLHGITPENTSRAAKGLTAAVFIFTVLLCVLPMGLSPSYNGENPDYMNQYELLAESLSNGHVYIDYDDVDPKLLALDNPYDPEARKAAGVSFHWDHAFYKGRYYMYFGVVPVFLLFLPYRLVTGDSLTTYHATQVFVLLLICGIFALFYKLSKLFFKNLSLALYLTMSAAFCAVSVWYSVSAPALYCTAISAAICMEVWSIFFFIQAVYGSHTEKRRILFAFFGSLFGALSFGCRPPIALANLLVLPLLAEYIKKRKLTPKLIGQLALAALPYLVVGLLLMTYNYVRFDNPFEFGQSYQLTIADQSRYGNFFSRFEPLKTLRSIGAFFAAFTPMSDQFPFVSFRGILFNFPILGFSVIGIFSKKVRRGLRETHTLPLVGFLFLLPVLIAFADVLWAPTVLERYRSDIYWLVCILCFFITGFCYENIPERASRVFGSLLSVLALLTICKCILLFLVPYDYNFTFYYVEKLEKIRKILMLGRGVGLY